MCISWHSRTVRSEVVGSMTMNKRSDVGTSLVGGVRVNILLWTPMIPPLNADIVKQ